MKLYYSPGAGSLASRIMLHEAGLDATFECVDLATKATESGADFRKVCPKGYVPALQLDDGEVLTENVAILYWISCRAPNATPRRRSSEGDGSDGVRGVAPVGTVPAHAIATVVRWPSPSGRAGGISPRG